jgi:tRNA(Ile)-lysidine synthase
MVVDTISTFLERQGIGPQRIVVACSGGVDSTALLLAFADLRVRGYEPLCAHVNHHLRGEESDGDEQFVRELCDRLGMDIRVADGAIDPESIRATGVEAAAREVRQNLLRGVALAAEARYVATAHQQNDQAETILMRMLSGTALGGLRGIHPIRDDGFIRPLIELPRREIETFLAERGVTPRLDRLNLDPRFVRNRVRQAIVAFTEPEIENLASIAEQTQQVWPIVERALDEMEKRCVRATETETRFHSWPDDAWSRQALLLRHIRRLGSAREISSKDLERLASSIDHIRRVSVTKDLELVSKRGALVLRRHPRPTPDFEVEVDAGVEIPIPEIDSALAIHATKDEKRKTKNAFQLPDDASPRFIIRNRRRGDRFQPLGMERDKKLKDFLIDRKIDAEVRDRLPLVIWNGKIVLIPGVEVSERFKVTSPGGVSYEVSLEHASQSQTADQH